MSAADGHGEIAADECDGLAATDDLDRVPDPPECARGNQPRQLRHMIEVSVGQQHLPEPAKPKPGAQQLALGSLPAIDQKPVGPVPDI